MAGGYIDAAAVLEAAARVRSDRASVLVTNLANADVPGYLPRDISFDSAMRQVMFDKGAVNAEARSTAIDLTVLRADGGGVDAAKELGKIYSNALAYMSVIKLFSDVMSRYSTVAVVA